MNIGLTALINEVKKYSYAISDKSTVFSFSGSQSEKFGQALNILEKKFNNIVNI